MMVESPPGIFLLSLPAPLQWPSAAVIPLPLIFTSTSACSLRCGHARYNTAWHQILSSVRGFVNKCRRPSIKKQVLAPLRHLSYVWSKTWVSEWRRVKVNWRVWARQKEPRRLCSLKLLQQRARRQVSRTAKGAPLLTLTFISRVKGGVDR